MIGQWLKRSSVNKVQVGIALQANGLAVAVCPQNAQLDIDQTPRVHQSHLLLDEADDTLGLLTNWVATAGLGKSPCNLVLSSEYYQLLLVEAPDVPEAEVREAVRWRIKDLITIPVEKAAIDIFMLPADGSRGGKKMAYVVVAELAKIIELVAMVKESGLHLVSIDIAELALRNLAYLKELEQPEGRGVAIAHLVEGGGTVSLYRKGNMYLSRHFKIAYNAGLLDDIPIDSFILEVQRSLDYYERQMAQPPPSALYICGENVSEDKLTMDILRGLSVPVKYLNLTQTVAAGEDAEEALLHTCVAALGGALRQTVSRRYQLAEGA